MVVIEYDIGGRLLPETELPAGLIPELMTVGKYLGSLDAVHDDAAVGRQYGQHFLHDGLQLSTVSTYEYGVRLK